KVKNGILEWTAPKGNWRLIALFNGKTLQKVKRAAPGGEGYVMDHFSAKAVDNYLANFDKAFSETVTPYPHTFFNDSYEVYGADWTLDLLATFYQRRGYRLEDYFPQFLDTARNETTARIISDYRETLSDLLKENFTQKWTDWAHQNGAITRNQAHGSPGNLIDLYATVDIPECEGFGLSEFHINGLRQDSLTRHNDSDLSMLKYASSGAHISGKKYTSSETFTWLTEHFRTSLSQCKPDLDLLFVSGVNHVFFHGTPYSPREEEWPGRLFYASMNMSPTNTVWCDAPAFFDYITRCQAFLQSGKPDNDFLLYLPIYDIWNEQPGTYLAFDIHSMQKRAPKFIETVDQIVKSGYDVDYISDDFIRSLRFENGKLLTVGGTSYKALIIPAVRLMPENVLNHILTLVKQGADVVFTEHYPEDIPGFNQLEKRRKFFRKILSQLPDNQFTGTTVKQIGKGRIITGNDYAATLSHTTAIPEEMKYKHDLQAVRRSDNEEGGYIYFVSALHEKDFDGWITLSVEAEQAAIFDPMTQKSGIAKIRQEDGKTQIYLQLRSGESRIIKTYSATGFQQLNKMDQSPVSGVKNWKYFEEQTVSLSLDHGWKLKFIDSQPTINGTFDIDRPVSWTTLDIPDAKINAGTALYSVEIQLPDIEADEWILDLGDVRESARVRINGQEAGVCWAVPFRLYVGEYLQVGINTIEIEVTNLPANRIADYDRKGIQWRKFKEINMVDLNYKPSDYGHWQPTPSGLNGLVRLIPVREIQN
ncbi:MAG: glycosyl hydrolase family 2, partial [Tannerella sp.]|nr:glycosyl hydrolase family 2 [Tannerella sp.]